MIETIIDAWHQLDFSLVVILFFAYAIVDGMYAQYTLDVTKREPFRAATVGSLMHFILAFGILNYIHNFLYIVPLALGSWIGTYCVVAREKANNQKAEKQGLKNE